MIYETFRTPNTLTTTELQLLAENTCIMLRSNISLANVIIDNYTSQLKSKLNSIQLKTNNLIERQKSINTEVKKTSREDFKANTQQCKRSVDVINKTNTLIMQVSKIHQEIISWSHMLTIIQQQPISNLNEMDITISGTKIPSAVENKILHELLTLFEKLEEYTFCGLVQKKILANAA